MENPEVDLVFRGLLEVLVLHAQLIQISQAVWLCVRDTFHELAERLTQPVAL